MQSRSVCPEIDDSNHAREYWNNSVLRPCSEPYEVFEPLNLLASARAPSLYVLVMQDSEEASKGRPLSCQAGSADH